MDKRIVMSKVGRNRKGRGHWAKPTGWKPAVATHEERIQVIRKKVNGVEKVSYKTIILPKKGVQIDDSPNRAERRRLAKVKT